MSHSPDVGFMVPLFGTVLVIIFILNGGNVLGRANDRLNRYRTIIDAHPLSKMAADHADESAARLRIAGPVIMVLVVIILLLAFSPNSPYHE